MQELTLDTLKEIMRRCLESGGGERVDLSGDILDVAFPDLDFDSLAVLELATRVQEEFKIPMPDEAVGEMTTPRNVLVYVNSALAKA